MTYKEAKEYHKRATEMLIKRSLGDIMDLQNELVEKFDKESKDIATSIKSISFFPYYQTASNDPASIERRGTAIRNGIQEIINILNQYLTTQKDKIDNRRFWLSLGLSIFAILLSIALWFVDKFLPLCN